jgi:glycosyltransferase involved in cell wall biosynthesis
MGRVAWHWRQELEARGYDFVHLGPAEVGRPLHPALFPWAAYRASRRLKPKPAITLVHEPAGLPFVLARRSSTLVFSHGLERPAWQAALRQATLEGTPIRRRSRLLFPLWRLAPADLALRRARALLVLNRDDLAYALQHYGRHPEDVHLFQNGVYPPEPTGTGDPEAILFVGTWIARKGIRTLAAAAGLLRRQGLAPRFLLAGTGLEAPAVLGHWPEELRASVQVIPRFTLEAELSLYAPAGLFVLPSFFEGQPLALLQAMAAGCCCIASDVAGSRDLIVHRETGLLHPPGDAGQLASCIAEALGDPALRQRLGDSARRAVADRTWQAAARDVVDFVERFL